MYGNVDYLNLICRRIGIDCSLKLTVENLGMNLLV